MSEHFTAERLENIFKHHPPSPGKVERHDAVRAAGLAMAKVIVDNTAQSREQTLAVNAVEEASGWANMAIACNEGE